MEKMAFIFPGQGAQFPGMGKSLDFFRVAKEVFEAFEKITGTRLFALDEKQLKQTKNQQPAIIAVILAIIRILQQKAIFSHIVAGNSLGEYGALTIAEVISWQDCLKIVYERGKLMQVEAEKNIGIMYAVNGLEIEKIQEIVDEVRKKGHGYSNISIACHNTKTQIVISGDPEPVILAVSIAQEKGAKVIPLDVNGAWHSESMRGAVDKFRQFLQGIKFYPPITPVLHNLTVAEENNPDRIREIMVGQICGRVRWCEIIGEMIRRDIKIFVEIGPGRVLTGFLRKTLPKDYPYKSFAICNLEELQKLEEFIKSQK